MKYRCLVLDHDDTVVNSTATIHYPCFLDFLKAYRPEVYAHGYTLEEYFRKNFDPGITALLRDEVGLDDAGIAFEYRYWCDYSRDLVPDAYKGIRSLLERFRSCGGHIAVVSHSVSENILRDYRANGLPEPELVFGWDCPPEHRKPSIWPLQQIMEHLSLAPEQLLVVDDLKPGYDMAKACGVPFAAAGWAYEVPEIEAFMRKNSDFYFKTIDALDRFLFGPGAED